MSRICIMGHEPARSSTLLSKSDSLLHAQTTKSHALEVTDVQLKIIVCVDNCQKLYHYLTNMDNNCNLFAKSLIIISNYLYHNVTPKVTIPYLRAISQIRGTVGVKGGVSIISDLSWHHSCPPQTFKSCTNWDPHLHV